MNTKQIESELNNLKQAVPTSCSNVIELCGRYLAASEKMPEKKCFSEHDRASIAGTTPWEEKDEYIDGYNAAIEECTIAMMKYADKLQKLEALSVEELQEPFWNKATHHTASNKKDYWIISKSDFNDYVQSIHAAMKKRE